MSFFDSKKIVNGAMIAAIYTVISLFLAPISYGMIQVRVSDALTLLPVLLPESVWGLTIGCLITNAIGVATGLNTLGALDILVGTLATFFAAIVTLKFKNLKLRNIPIISSFSPVIFNGIFLGAEFSFVLSGSFNLKLFILYGFYIAAGEFLACFILGNLLIRLLENKLLKR